jgi:hypothetical protein
MHNLFIKKSLLAILGLILVFSLLGYSGAAPASAQGNVFYVAPDGRSGNNGSQGSPWDLQTALNQPSAVKPGAFIYLRGGTYRGAFVSKLKGNATGWITVRALGNERVTLTNDGNPALEFRDTHYVRFWGLEITGPNKTRSTSRPSGAYGVRVHQGSVGSSSNIAMINMIVHDVQAQGIGWWQALTNAEIYGSMFYYNGTTQLDHGVYAHNVNGTKVFRNNIVFDNASHGFHGYAETNEKGLNNLVVDRNIFFNNGSIGYNTSKNQYGIYKRNILVGGLIRTNNTVITNNATYYPGNSGVSLNVGYSGGSNNTHVEGNYFAGGGIEIGGSASQLVFKGNNIYVPGGLSGISQSNYGSNNWFSSKPRDVRVTFRGNQYDRKRGHVVVYNWPKHNEVLLTAAHMNGGLNLVAGQAYELRNVQNYYGDVIRGVYDGNAIRLPMTGRSVAQPLGLNFKPASTFPEFGTFVIIAQ